MSKYVELYRKFTDFVETPPKNLELGHVSNAPTIYDDYGDKSATESILAIAVKCLMSGDEMVSRIFHQEKGVNINITYEDKSKRSYYYSGNSTQTLYTYNSRILLEHAEKAPYGNTKDGVTGVDESVRLCYQIVHGEKYKIQDLPESLVETINNNMYPGKDIKIVPNKMNIYLKGGHFARHKDSPKPGVIGTVVVFDNNTTFEGGHLVLEDTENNLLKYNKGIVAFYNNIPHWVEHVTDKVRITTTYYIMENGDEEDEDSDSDEDSDMDMEDSIKILKKQEPFGVILSETYGDGEKFLKGQDKILGDRLNCNFRTTMLPVILKYNQTYCDGDGDDEIDITCSVYRCMPVDFIAYSTKTDYTRNIYDHIEFIHTGSRAGADEQYGKMIKSEHQDYIEHVGNECQEGFYDNVYLHRVLVVENK